MKPFSAAGYYILERAEVIIDYRIPEQWYTTSHSRILERSLNGGSIQALADLKTNVTSHVAATDRKIPSCNCLKRYKTL